MDMNNIHTTLFLFFYRSSKTIPNHPA
jgi:hypothetical protein